MLICIKVVLFFPRLSFLIDYNCLKVPFSLVCLPHITNSRLSCVRLRQADVVVLSVEVFCIRGSIIQDPFEVSIPLVFGLSGLGSVFLFWGDGANGGITRSCLGAPSLYHLQNLAWGSGWRSVQLLIKPKFDPYFEAISQIVSSFVHKSRNYNYYLKMNVFLSCFLETWRLPTITLLQLLLGKNHIIF